MIRLLTPLVPTLLLASSPRCGSTDPPETTCNGYPCTEAGARAMIEDVAERHEPAMDPAARDALQRLTDAGLQRLREDLSPEGFTRTEEALDSIFEAMPSGVESPIPMHLDDVTQGAFSLCPLWPFC